MEDICFWTLLWEFKIMHIIKNKTAYSNMNNSIFLSIVHVVCDPSHKYCHIAGDCSFKKASPVQGLLRKIDFKIDGTLWKC